MTNTLSLPGEFSRDKKTFTLAHNQGEVRCKKSWTRADLTFMEDIARYSITYKGEEYKGESKMALFRPYSDIPNVKVLLHIDGPNGGVVLIFGFDDQNKIVHVDDFRKTR